MESLANSFLAPTIKAVVILKQKALMANLI
ncbi:Uncharacterised protein [Helicobacter fennelliae]|nr:Uncharacterised protein [Helicobacter fennelliae]